MAHLLDGLADAGELRVSWRSRSGESSKPTTATSSGHAAGRRRSRTDMAPAAIRSDAAKTASMSGWMASSRCMAARAALLGEVAERLEGGVEADPAFGQGVAVAAQAVDAGDHVLRAGDRRDDPATGRDEVRDRGLARPGGCRRRRSWRWRPSAAGPTRTIGIPAAVSASGQGIVAVEADQQGAVDVAGRQVVGGPPLVGRGLGHEQDQLPVAGGQLGADAAQQAREERVGEQSAGRLGDDDGDRVAAAGDEAAGGPVGGVAEPFDRGLDVDPDVGADAWASRSRPVRRSRGRRPPAGRPPRAWRSLRRLRPLGLRHRHSVRVRALSRLICTLAGACQESALTHEWTVSVSSGCRGPGPGR